MSELFFEALDIRRHPIRKAEKEIKEKYKYALTYIIDKILRENITCRFDTKIYVTERLRVYNEYLFDDILNKSVNEEFSISCIVSLGKLKKSQYLYMLVCDISLILMKDTLILQGLSLLNKYLSDKHKAAVKNIFSLMVSKRKVANEYLAIQPLINQYRENSKFLSKKIKKIIVTANVSAGKSTLINALIGKHVARTSQEICTGNISYLFNKAYEDGSIYIANKYINFSADENDLKGTDREYPVSIVTYFNSINQNIPRLCLIDTPGVDAALYKTHSECTYNELMGNNYDIVVCVVNPTQLGADAQIKHLQWVSKNLQKEKVIFVLNKLDNYDILSDSIDESIGTFKKELLALEFENPVICPISAYFSYLLKLKMSGQILSEDEEDDYYVYAKKFRRPYYDLSRYYDGVKCLYKDTEEVRLSKLAGLYGLEKILYGGRL